jgi:VIT1/CCC1 family predicted Fe2+/Mn2+ transporter
VKLQPKPALLGAADGVTSISGVVAAAGATSSAHHTAVVAVAGAVSATVSMAGAELISEDEVDASAVISMGIGTLLGSALPVVPLLLVAGLLGWGMVALVSLGIACAVGEIRARSSHRSRKSAYSVTLLLVTFGAALGYVLGLV